MEHSVSQLGIQNAYGHVIKCHFSASPAVTKYVVILNNIQVKRAFFR